jgi:hypothetical protein
MVEKPQSVLFDIVRPGQGRREGAAPAVQSCTKGWDVAGERLETLREGFQRRFEGQPGTRLLQRRLGRTERLLGRTRNVMARRRSGGRESRFAI